MSKGDYVTAMYIARCTNSMKNVFLQRRITCIIKCLLIRLAYVGGEFNDQIALIMNVGHRFIFFCGLIFLKLFFGKLFFTFALLSTSSLFHNETKIVDPTNLRFHPEIFRFV